MPTRILKIILIVFLILAVAAGLVYLGYWWGLKKSAAPATKTRAGQEQIREVPYGDENFETDEDYQRAMRELTEEGPSGEESPWLTYTNEAHGFSFQYPVSVFLEETDGVNRPLVYLDTELIIIPPAYGGQLTPVEIRVPPLIDNTRVEEEAASFRQILYPDAQEKELKPPLKGVRVSGTCQGFPCEGEEYQQIIIESSKGLIVINHLPRHNFNQALLDSILNTFKVF